MPKQKKKKRKKQPKVAGMITMENRPDTTGGLTVAQQLGLVPVTPAERARAAAAGRSVLVTVQKKSKIPGAGTKRGKKKKNARRASISQTAIPRYTPGEVQLFDCGGGGI